MDQLSRDARDARKAGLSYGYYIPVKNAPRNEQKDAEHPCCVVCGAQMIGRNKGTKYCSDACKDRAKYQRKVWKDGQG